MKIRTQTRPADQASQDNLNALAARNADMIEYIAMMADVEIPTDEEEAVEDEQEV